MPDCYVYDHVRTPRGSGKPDGAMTLGTVLDELERRDLGIALVTPYIGCTATMIERT